MRLISVNIGLPREINWQGRVMRTHFLESKRTGFYLAVVREGEVGKGDGIYFKERQEDGVTIADIVNLYTVDSENQELLRRATELPALPDGWKIIFASASGMPMSDLV